MTAEVIDVMLPPIDIIDVTPTAVEMLEVIVGPRGPAGPAGAGATVYRFTDLATWSCTHNLARPPVVTLYDDLGRPFSLGSLLVTDTTVIASLPTAMSGSMVIV